MKHRKCGGKIVEDRKVVYVYKRDDDIVEKHRRLLCLKCGREVIGDSQIAKVRV